MDEAQARVQREVKLPAGYYLTWGGEFENQRRAMKRLELIVPVSILVIFCLLYLTFRAVLPAVVVLLDVPFATVGGVFALYFTHTELSVSAAVGFITLFGVAVMDGVLLILYVRQARERTPDSQDAILRSGLAAAAARVDDRAAGLARSAAGGDVSRHWVGYAAPVRDRDHRRPGLVDAADHAACSPRSTSWLIAGSAPDARRARPERG